MKIGIIGAGMIGATLARRLTTLGREVVIANSRGPETLRDLAAETGARAVTADVATKVEQLRLRRQVKFSINLRLTNRALSATKCVRRRRFHLTSVAGTFQALRGSPGVSVSAHGQSIPHMIYVT